MLTSCAERGPARVTTLHVVTEHGIQYYTTSAATPKVRSLAHNLTDASSHKQLQPNSSKAREKRYRVRAVNIKLGERQIGKIFAGLVWTTQRGFRHHTGLSPSVPNGILMSH